MNTAHSITFLARSGIAPALLIWAVALAAPSTSGAQPIGHDPVDRPSGDRPKVDRPAIDRPAGNEVHERFSTEPPFSHMSRPWVQSAWTTAHAARTRLVAGNPTSGGRGHILAGLEIRLAQGWKTYWRHPGDDGGLPPSFDFSASRNLARAHVLYPVPHRIKGLNGYTVGYKNAVVFPIEIEASDPAKPISLDLALEYGICLDICVPIEVRLRLEIPPRLSGLPPGLGLSLASVPRTSSAPRPTDPSLKSAKATLTGSKPSLEFEIATGAAADVDLLVETTNGLYLPLPRKSGPVRHGRQHFLVPLAGIDGIATLAGTELRLTMLSGDAGVETMWTVR